jgi:hypothetical protein
VMQQYAIEADLAIALVIEEQTRRRGFLQQCLGRTAVSSRSWLMISTLRKSGGRACGAPGTMPQAFSLATHADAADRGRLAAHRPEAGSHCRSNSQRTLVLLFGVLIGN